MENKHLNNIRDIKSDSKLVLSNDDHKINLETDLKQKSNKIWNKIKSFFNFQSNKKKDSVSIEEANHKIDESIPKSKLKVFWNFFRLPLVVTACLGIACGIIYPIVITGIGQSVFSYQANGSVIKVKDKNGNWQFYGSDKIGQDFYTNNNGQYLFGRADYTNGATDQEIQDLATTKISDLIINNSLQTEFQDNNGKIVIPNELVTKSASMVDPQISISAAKWQIPLIIKVRKDLLNQEISEATIEGYINKYSDKKFTGVFGNNTTNVLLVNLAIDGII